MIPRLALALVLATVGLINCRHARAQFAVIDVAAIVQDIQQLAQLEQQVETAKEQLSTAQDQLTQARAHLAAITGTRNMQQLLSGINRNYLPGSAADLEALLSGSAGAFAALGSQVEGAVQAAAVLSGTAVGQLNAAERATLMEDRRRVALGQAMSAQALAAASDRFGKLQSLIDAIGSASDEKAVLDLQARIQAEQGMLANEALKDRLLSQSLAAQEAVRRQQVREQAVADIGSVRDLPPLGLLP
jgi:type IV secretion system protein VirB5